MRPSDGLDRLLRQAIADTRLIQCAYHGRRRVVEPHDYGVQTRVPRLLVYQLRADGTAGGDAKGWRLLDVGKLTEVVMLGERFPGSRGGAHERHMSWDEIYARVR